MLLKMLINYYYFLNIQKENGLDYTNNIDEEVKRKALFQTTYDMVMNVNLDPKSTYTLTMYYPHSIEVFNY